MLGCLFKHTALSGLGAELQLDDFFRTDGLQMGCLLATERHRVDPRLAQEGKAVASGEQGEESRTDLFSRELSEKVSHSASGNGDDTLCKKNKRQTLRPWMLLVSYL